MAVADEAEVIASRYWQRTDVDVTGGRFPAPPYRYVAIHDISVDGAEAAGDLIERLVAAHDVEESARTPATLLTYPSGELAGIERRDASYVTLAFARPYDGQEREFFEWYPTRHIRHALTIGALTSGRTHVRTRYQHSTASDMDFQIVAVYEQTGEPEEFITQMGQLKSASPDALAFPAMEKSGLVEAAYRRFY